jgi:L-aspartate oxidase
LYISGECSRTGLHGANRLASNSLLEALVFSHQSYLDSISRVEDLEIEKGIEDWDVSGTVEPKEMVLITQTRRELREIMSKYVGIVRSNQRLKRAQKRIKLLYEDTEELYRESIVSPQLCELRNMITVGYLIVEQSLKRKENRGGYYNVDCEK